MSDSQTRDAACRRIWNVIGTVLVLLLLVACLWGWLRNHDLETVLKRLGGERDASYTYQPRVWRSYPLNADGQPEPPCTSCRRPGTNPAHVKRVPSIIWTYWHSTTSVPPLVQHNIARWRRMLGKWYDIRLLNRDTVSEWIDESEVPRNLHTHQVAHQADWYRLYLLNRYGGIWADTGILFNDVNVLLNMQRQAEREQVDYAGFYLEQFQTVPHRPVIENWFIMCPETAPGEERTLISLWLQEYTLAVNMGFKAYKQYAVQQLNVNPQKLFKLPNEVYLTCHLCMQTVLQIRIRPRSYRIYVVCAEDTAFRLHKALNWDLVQLNKALVRPECLAIPMIKMRGPDRMMLDMERFIETYQ